jgi:hypothetical protein
MKQYAGYCMCLSFFPLTSLKDAVCWPTEHTLRIHLSVLCQVKRVFDTTLFNRIYISYTGKVRPIGVHDGLDGECRMQLQLFFL